LAAALPIVRDNVGPEQVNRVEAERLAQSLGMRL
jgi:hypothetical protein